VKRLAVALVLLATPALGQSPGQPGQFLPSVPPAGPVQTSPLPPPVFTPGTQGPGFSPVPLSPVAPLAPVVPAAPEWLPQGAVDLRALDKVTARSAPLSGKVGETLKFGSLSVTVRQCVIRPPDKTPDAAAWLEITDSTGGPGFKGWMLASMPAMSMLEHPGYDIRVAGCRP
jgi:hypothetical protein